MKVLNKVIRPTALGDNEYEFGGTVTYLSTAVITDNADSSYAGTKTFEKPIIKSVETAIEALAGGGQALATLLTKDFNDVVTVASDYDSIRLPSAVAGQHCIIKNSSANILSVFPFLADSINAMAVNLSVDIPPLSIRIFYAKNTTVWESNESLYISSPTSQKGGLQLLSADNTGNTITQIINALQAGARVYTIPDAGGNSEFSMGAIDIADYSKFLGINDVLDFITGTWTTTRVAQGDYVKRKTATDETSTIAIDITEAIRDASLKGLKLASFDVINRNITEALDAHSVTLDLISYVDSEAVTTTIVALTGTLETEIDADPRVTNVVVDTPAYNNTADSKYVMELTVNAAASSVYDFIGVMLHFTRNDK